MEMIKVTEDEKDGSLHYPTEDEYVPVDERRSPKGEYGEI